MWVGFEIDRQERLRRKKVQKSLVFYKFTNKTSWSRFFIWDENNILHEYLIKTSVYKIGRTILIKIEKFVRCVIKIKRKMRKSITIAIFAVVISSNVAPVVGIDAGKGSPHENGAFVLPSGRTRSYSGEPDKGGSGGSSGGGGGSSFDFRKPIKQADINNLRDKIRLLRDFKKQCEPSEQENIKPTVTEKFSTTRIRRVVNGALSNQDVKREYNSYIQKLKNGYPPEKLGNRTKDNFFLIKGKHVRILVEISKNKDDIKILGVGFRGNIRDFEKTMNSEYNANLQYTKF